MEQNNSFMPSTQPKLHSNLPTAYQTIISKPLACSTNQQIILKEQNASQVYRNLFSEKNLILSVDYFQKETLNVFEPLCQTFEMVRQTKIERKIVEKSVDSKIFLFAKKRLPKQIEQMIGTKIRAIFYINQDIDQQDEARQYICTYKNQAMLRKKGRIEYKSLTNLDMPSINTPNLSSDQDAIKKQVFSNNLNWILNSPTTLANAQDFIKLFELYKKSKRISKRDEKLIDMLKRGELQNQYQCVKAYTCETFFYKIVNRGLRNFYLPEYLPYIKYPVYHLYKQLMHLYQEQIKTGKLSKDMICYRGCYLTEQELLLFPKCIGQEIVLEGFISTSTNEEIKNLFGIQKLIIQVPGNTDLKRPLCQLSRRGAFAKISEIASNETEQEVLFTPQSRFKVIKVEITEQDIFQSKITLKFIAPAQVIQNGNNELVSKYQHCQQGKQNFQFFIQLSSHEVMIKNQQELLITLGMFQKQAKYQIINIISKVRNAISSSHFTCSQIKMQEILKWMSYLQRKQTQSTFNQKETSSKYGMIPDPFRMMRLYRPGILTKLFRSENKGKQLIEARISAMEKIKKMNNDLTSEILRILSQKQNLMKMGQQISDIISSIYLCLDILFYTKQNLEKTKSNKIQDLGNYKKYLFTAPYELSVIYKQIQQAIQKVNYSAVIKIFEEKQDLFTYFVKNSENSVITNAIFSLVLYSYFKIGDEENGERFTNKFFSIIFGNQANFVFNFQNIIGKFGFLISWSPRKKNVVKRLIKEGEKAENPSLQLEGILKYFRGLDCSYSTFFSDGNYNLVAVINRKHILETYPIVLQTYFRPTPIPFLLKKANTRNPSTTNENMKDQLLEKVTKFAQKTRLKYIHSSKNPQTDSQNSQISLLSSIIYIFLDDFLEASQCLSLIPSCLE